MRLRMIILGLALLATPAVADMRADCAQDSDHALRIKGCSAALASGKWPGRQGIWALNNRGLAYVAQGMLDKAIADYDKALELDPNHTTVLDNRGNAHALKGNLDRALADHNKAIKADPKNANAYNNRAADYMDMRELERALPDLDRAIELNGDYGDAFKNRAQVRCYLEMADGAERDWLEALRTGRVSEAGLQRDLQKAGHYSGEIDGNFGSGSRAALSAWVADGCR